MSIDEMIAMYDRQAAEHHRLALEATRRADDLRRARLETKTVAGVVTWQDVEAVHGTDACGYRW